MMRLEVRFLSGPQNKRMKLYRGYKKRPHIATPKMEEEYQALKEEITAKQAELRSRLGKDPLITDLLREVGQEKIVRFNELRQIVGDQFFADQEIVAREFAGEKGFVITLDVPDDVANAHYRGEQVMRRGTENRYVSNFVFRGNEIRELNQENPNFVQLDEIGKEKESKGEIEVPKDYLPGGPERM